MATTVSEAASSNQLRDVPWNEIVQFIRQLSHDLRNHLNAVELQSAYVAEIATDAEVKDEIKRLRGMLSGLGTVLQKLSADMAAARPTLMSYKAADFLEDLRRKMESTDPTPAIDWDVQVGDAAVDLDPQLLPLAVQELLANATRHGDGRPLKISATIDRANSFVFTLTEPKEHFEATTENWGREPLRNITQGHYGLGLNRARLIVESHGGHLAAHYDQPSKNLVTTITMPVSPEKS